MNQPSEVGNALRGVPALADDDTQQLRVRRSWGAKFAAAFRGIKLGVRGHSSFFVHFFFAAISTVPRLPVG